MRIVLNVTLSSGYRTKLVTVRSLGIEGGICWNNFLAKLRLEYLLLSPGEAVEAFELGINVYQPTFVPFYDGSCVSLRGSKDPRGPMGQIHTFQRNINLEVCGSDSFLVCEP